MNTNRSRFTFVALMLATMLSLQAQRVFIYSPDERAGLHLAADKGKGWQEIGQLCASDYGQWGVEKRMYHPSLTRAMNGTWRLVFQVNDTAPLFAAAYSEDLVTWRPQEYPTVSAPGVSKPVIFTNEDGSFDIYYKSPQGKRFVSATPDFRHFSKDEPSQIGEDAWLRDTATIDGKLREGCQFLIGDDELRVITNHFDRLRDDAQLSSERMYEDAKNFPGLQPVSATLTITGQEKPISDKLIGVFFEDISYAADGGLYAELVQNRDFEYSARDHQGWTATTAWHCPQPIRIATDNPLSQNNPHYALLTDQPITNEGWDGIAVQKGKKYDFSMFVRGEKSFVIMLMTPNDEVVAQAKVKVKGDGWQQCQTVLTARQTCDNARLVVFPQKTNEVAVDMISLFPQETFKNRKNGLRRDLAQAIADLHPKFVRFPGGCMSHGQGLENIYHWNHTVGPLQDRKPDFNIWNYHQTRGLGFFEYFQFCEDIGAEPLPVLAAGVPCQNSQANALGIGGQQGGIPMADMPAYIQELLDMIEWANGDPQTSKWAKMRADAGHPAPFNLKYIGIGNEDIIGTVFEERYEMICRAIRQKYPEIKICGTVGPFHTPSADYIEGWDFTKKHPDLQYMTDEHYYESTGWFMHHRDYYDNYDRDAAKVYLGEYAASTNARRPNVETALAEALYLTDVERNGDVVEMTSYAPMLAKDGHHNWNPDMIYFSNTEVRPTPAYETQRLFSVYGGDRYVKSSLKVSAKVRHRVGASLVHDSKTGKRYLKLVNALPVELNLSLEGLRIPAGTPSKGFCGQPEDQQLTLIDTTVGDGSGSLVLPPYSFQVMEVKVEAPAHGNLQMGDHYLYCHMNDAGPAWTAYALSRDGHQWHDLLNGDSIFSDREMAPIEGRSRDAFICRKHDGSGYLMVFTDMEATDASRDRLGKQSTWDNYGICLLTSDDLIHWQSKGYDYRKGTSIFCNPTDESVYCNWSTINRVWAPQIMWDPTYQWPDGRQGGYLIYYSMLNRAEEQYDRMYYSYADETFTQLTQPRLLFDWGYATIDADINWVEADQQWHMMIKKEGGKPGLFTATSKQLTGPWSEPVEDDYVNFEGNKKCEGVSAFQLAGSDKWMIGYIEYSSHPKNYRICEADRYMRNFKNPQNIQGVARPQHGSFMRITEQEYQRLQQWSDGRIKELKN